MPRQLIKNIDWMREIMLDGSDGDLDIDRLSLEVYRFLFENKNRWKSRWKTANGNQFNQFKLELWNTG
ncbi:hypothetical protein DCS65_19780 [Bacillus subtilis]|nr:hypothetical protein [Bacillus subtilis]PWI59333.1 hypothetical protein DCS65_19780 [Bacillus subtilis]WEY89368.1 hypothetical protein P5628_04205 [Bacillus subtilis]